jgi:hypothetical protein
VSPPHAIVPIRTIEVTRKMFVLLRSISRIG